MNTNNTVWNLVVAILYVLLFAAAIVRLVAKFACGRKDPSGPSATLVFTALSFYCAARATVVFLVYSGQVSHLQGVTENLYDAIPGTLFDVLQTAMIAKWVGHANDISLVVRRQEFVFGPVALWISVAMTVINIIAAIVCAALCKPKGPNDDLVWNDVLNIFSGAAYVVNGVFFSGLGFSLRSMWNPTNTSDKLAAARILCMALFFGGMCAVRGGLLIGLAASGGRMQDTAASWGPPCALTAEWVCLVVSMFVLTGSRGQARQATTPTSAYKPQSSRRASVLKWFSGRINSSLGSTPRGPSQTSPRSSNQQELIETPIGSESLINGEEHESPDERKDAEEPVGTERRQ